MEKFTEKIESNKTQNNKSKIYCNQCNRETNHVVLQSIDRDGSEIVFYHDDGCPETIDWSDNYQIIQCQGCDSISFCHISWFSEDVQPIGPNEWFNGTKIKLYPKRSERNRPLLDYYNVPNTIRRIYRETIECYNNDLYTLCAAGLRTIIEGICADQSVKDGPIKIKKSDGTTQTERRKNLEGKIAGLGEKGILTEKNTNILNEHRFLGNEAMHELNQPSSDELMLAIDIIEHTLDSLYEMPDKAAELRRQRAIRKKTF